MGCQFLPRKEKDAASQICDADLVEDGVPALNQVGATGLAPPAKSLLQSERSEDSAQDLIAPHILRKGFDRPEDLFNISISGDLKH